jgi:hypothetical protein
VLADNYIDRRSFIQRNKKMDEKTKAKVLRAIEAQGAPGNGTPSEPIIGMLRELANACQFREMSEAFTLFRARYPQNAIFVGCRMPAVISNALCRNLDIGAEFVDLAVRRPSWPDEIIGTIGDPDSFVAIIESLKVDLQKKAA